MMRKGVSKGQGTAGGMISAARHAGIPTEVAAVHSFCDNHETEMQGIVGQPSPWSKNELETLQPYRSVAANGHSGLPSLTHYYRNFSRWPEGLREILAGRAARAPQILISRIFGDYRTDLDCMNFCETNHAAS